MDPLVRSRRGVNNQGEPVATGSQLEREYAAALSQADPGREFQGAVGLTVAGEASPGTMEQGEAEPLPLLTASPFHSQRIHEEVELLKKRPIGLDLEQARLDTGRTTQDDSLEPDYSLAFPSNSGLGPRVARVEATDSDWNESRSHGGGRKGFLCSCRSFGT